MIVLDTHIWLNWLIQGETGETSILPGIAAALRSEEQVSGFSDFQF